MNREELKELVKQHFNLVESPESFSEATLEDGTKVMTEQEGDFEVGQALFVVDAEGNKVQAPEGEHITESGIQLIVDAEGILTGVKYPDAEGEGSADMAEELPDVGPAKILNTVEEEMAEHKDEEKMEEEEDKMEAEMPKLEEIIEVIGEVVEARLAEVKEEMKDKIKMMEDEVAEIKEKMSAFAAEPAEDKSNPNTKKFSKSDATVKHNKYTAQAYERALAKLTNK